LTDLDNDKLEQAKINEDHIEDEIKDSETILDESQKISAHEYTEGIIDEQKYPNKENRVFTFIDNIWKFFSKEERMKRIERKKHKTVKIVVYKPKSQLRKFISLMIWLSFLFLLGFVFYKGYTFTNNLVKQVNVFDPASAIGEIDDSNEKVVNIPRGATTKDIAKVLLDEGIIANDTYFWVYSLLMGNEGNYKSGNHIFDASVTYDSGEIDLITAQGYEMLIYILSQDSVPNPTKKIFFTEGLTIAQTVQKFTDNGIGVKEDFYSVCNNYDFTYDFIKQIPQDSRRTNRLEGYLFPDTYIFDITVEENENIKKMLDNFNVKFNETYRAKAEDLGFTIDEIVIIASLLEKEASTMDEKAMIAGVIYNRLKSDDTYLNYLQVDATIQYIYLNETGKVKELLTNEDHEIMNSYNTYMYKGLPPGPICNPSLTSIAAALYPEVHNYYYYVAKNDGTDAHAYATTLAQHNYNIALYSK
jgi:UPF0755 protein